MGIFCYLFLKVVKYKYSYIRTIVVTMCGYVFAWD